MRYAETVQGLMFYCSKLQLKYLLLCYKYVFIAKLSVGYIMKVYNVIVVGVGVLLVGLIIPIILL